VEAGGDGAVELEQRVEIATDALEITKRRNSIDSEYSQGVWNRQGLD
jgi:hypothetical protein